VSRRRSYSTFDAQAGKNGGCCAEGSHTRVGLREHPPDASLSVEPVEKTSGCVGRLLLVVLVAHLLESTDQVLGRPFRLETDLAVVVFLVNVDGFCVVVLVDALVFLPGFVVAAEACRGSHAFVWGEKRDGLAAVCGAMP